MEGTPGPLAKPRLGIGAATFRRQGARWRDRTGPARGIASGLSGRDAARANMDVGRLTVRGMRASVEISIKIETYDAAAICIDYTLCGVAK